MADINIRIDKETHARLKKIGKRFGMSMKEIVAVLSLSKFPIKMKV